MKNKITLLLVVLISILIISCEKDSGNNEKILSNNISSIDVYTKINDSLVLNTTLRRNASIIFQHESRNGNIDVYKASLLDFSEQDRYFELFFQDNYIMAYKYKKYTGDLYQSTRTIDSSYIKRNSSKYMTDYFFNTKIYDTIVGSTPSIINCNTTRKITYNTNNSINTVNSNIVQFFQNCNLINLLYPVFGEEFSYTNSNVSINDSLYLDLSDLIYTFMFADVFSHTELIEFQKLIYNNNLKINPTTKYFPSKISMDEYKAITMNLFKKELSIKYNVANNRLNSIEVNWININRKYNLVYKINYQ